MITISSIGYVATDITVSANTSVYDVRLAPDTELLDEVVVVGFGTQRKADLTDAVSTVDTEVLQSRPVTNLGQALQGAVPDLNLSVGGYGGQRSE